MSESFLRRAISSGNATNDNNDNRETLVRRRRRLSERVVVEVVLRGRVVDVAALVLAG